MKEFFLALLLVSGPLKAHLNLLEVPLPDITILSALLCVIVIFFNLVQNSFKFKVNQTSISFIAVIGAFTFFAALSGFWSLSPSYWMTKWLLFLLPLFACLYPIILSSFDLDAFYKKFIFLSFVTSGFFIYYFPQWRLGLLNDSGMDLESYKTVYLGVGGLAGMSILLIFGRPQNFRLLIRVFLYIFFVVTLFVTSARGAVLLTTLCVTLVGLYNLANVLISKRMGKESLFFPLILIIALSLTLAAKDEFSGNIVDLIKHSTTRIGLLFEDNKGASVSSRVEHIEIATQGIDENPFLGNGMASYGVFRTGLDKLDHPHNIFLEIWFEQGIIGLILILVALLIPLYSSLEANRIEIVACLLFQIGISLISFSYAENRIMFAFLGLAVVTSFVVKWRTKII